MSVLVTGGLGYIGSNTVVELINKGYEVVVVDNLSNSTIQVVDYINQITGVSIEFYNTDVTLEKEMDKVFSKHKFDGIIHFAGFKAVGESVNKPLMYYENNLLSTIVLSKLCIKYDIKNFIFSSSATVYGNNISPLTETMDLLPTTNPYGETKVMCEKILIDTAKVSDLNVVILRYFNPVGGHESGLLSEKPKGIPNNLMPCIQEVARGKREFLSIFGNDYNTIDGTGVRDYIHVTDLAIGHVLALNHIKAGVNIYNLGTGVGTSVLELVNKYMEVNNIDVPYVITKRRSGDIDTCFADCSKAEKELNFKTKYGLLEMCKDFIN